MRMIIFNFLILGQIYSIQLKFIADAKSDRKFSRLEETKTDMIFWNLEPKMRFNTFSYSKNFFINKIVLKNLFVKR